MPPGQGEDDVAAREERMDIRADPEIYRHIVESIRDYAVFALDPQGIVVTWNPGAQALKGYRANEIVGRHFSAFYPDEDVARGKPAHELSVASEYGRFEDEGWRVRADGSTFWANVVITAMRAPTGELVGFSKVTRDLTERRQAEVALRLSEERFRLLVEGVQDYAIILLDTTGRIQSWNTGAERLTGYRAREIVGERIHRFYTSEDKEAQKPELELETAARDGRYEDEGWRVRKDGTRFWANVVVTGLRDPVSGNLLGYSKVTRDLTERREAEQSLRRAYADLEAFSYTVSHDLRAPLRSIHTLGEALRASALDTEQRTHVDAIVRSATEGTKLVEDLLQFARASGGEIREDEVDLAELAREIAEHLEADERHRVRFSVKPDPAMVVRGDRALLRLALENLLSNAWKFTRKTAEPRVEFARVPPRDGRPAAFVVRDNGAGFDPARAGALFAPFHRLHSQLEFPGTGIGLATVFRVVRRHGGAVWATGRPGQGASFYFALGD